MLKKIGKWAFILFLVYFVISYPMDAAWSSKVILAWMKDVGDAFAVLVTDVFTYDY